jgi:hypothetical protein
MLWSTIPQPVLWLISRLFVSASFNVRFVQPSTCIFDGPLGFIYSNPFRKVGSLPTLIEGRQYLRDIEITMLLTRLVRYASIQYCKQIYKQDTHLVGSSVSQKSRSLKRLSPLHRCIDDWRSLKNAGTLISVRTDPNSLVGRPLFQMCLT